MYQDNYDPHHYPHPGYDSPPNLFTKPWLVRLCGLLVLAFLAGLVWWGTH